MRDINSLNKAILIGRLGQKPELRYLPQTERAVARFSLATNERFFNTSTNESEDRVEWHRIVAWGKLAEFCEKLLDQGKQIYLEGKIRTRSWQDREGNKKYTTEIEAQNIVLLGKKDDTLTENRFDKSPPDDINTEEGDVPGGDNSEDDEVPF
ncbi:MAG: single-stranded DNA-binding protein [Candidatus Aminicenantes bacterium]|nr:single-stranded DNA-binding protein [Candidatus Aminicenantes bacterium]